MFFFLLKSWWVLSQQQNEIFSHYQTSSTIYEAAMKRQRVRSWDENSLSEKLRYQNAFTSFILDISWKYHGWSKGIDFLHNFSFSCWSCARSREQFVWKNISEIACNKYQLCAPGAIDFLPFSLHITEYIAICDRKAKRWNELERFTILDILSAIVFHVLAFGDEWIFFETSG